ncbi:hypothetical protein [Limnohabitans sp. INBF002]|uniref:hypothetical protein n=1 Tax=Limnohabitans sp. INBF002 TaxID=2986280 RepID=UPI0023772F98|nr:hypothetical protein [Limnohabitans sp. INBF002]BDU51962.1 hypothetical protein LINBF2_01970 [Limnohabitans sp. INBF002]
MRVLNFLALALSIALTACGGGGGGGGSPATQQSAEGVWVGSTTSSSGTTTPAIGLILDSGEYFFGTGSDYSGVSFGTASVSGTTITSTNMQDYYPSLNALIQGTFTGSVSTGSNLNVNISETYSGTTYTGTGSFTFDTTYNEPSALATIAGTYVSPNAFSSSYTYTVDANGVLTGASTNCTFAGQLTVRNSAKNIYNLSLTTANTTGHTCVVGARTLQGAATYVVMPGRTRRALVLISLASANNYYYWVTAAGEKQ